MECHISKRRVLLWMLLDCLMIATAYYVKDLPHWKALVAGWLGLPLFGSAFIVLLVRLFMEGPVLTISDNGIEDRRMKVGLIPWGDIRCIRMRKVHSQRFICIDLVDETTYLQRLPWRHRLLRSANRAFGASPLGIAAHELDRSLDDVWDHIAERRPELVAADTPCSHPA